MNTITQFGDNVSVSDLSRFTSKILRHSTALKSPVTVYNWGKPTHIIMPITRDEPTHIEHVNIDDII